MTVAKRNQSTMAEREGFEPSIPLRVCRISSAVLSTAQPPLQTVGRALDGPASEGADPSDGRGGVQACVSPIRPRKDR
jgi:hypothetical protein